MITLDVTSFFSSSAGGIRSYYEAKARWLPRRGVECHFVVPGAQRAVSRFGEGWLHEIPGPSLDLHYRCFGDLGALQRTIREIAPDVVEVGSHYVLPQLVASARQRAVTVGFYHADFPGTYVAPALRRVPAGLRTAGIAAAWWLVRAQHGRYAATLAASHGVAARLGRRGVPRVRWIGLGVDLEQFRPRPRSGRRFVAYLGRLARDKELSLLLEAAPEIERRSGARVVVAGSGPLAGEVEEAARRGVVEQVGLLDRDAAAALLADADAVVVPGRHETFGLAAAEAVASGTPVIAADRGGASELVARTGAGRCFPAGSAAGLAAAVAELYDGDRDALRVRALAGRAELGWAAVFDRLLDVYREVRC
jgi:alpha-1,6-mannosyltransferase